MTRFSTIGAFALAALLASAGVAASEERVQTGALTCRGAGTTGFIIGSVHHLRCIFRPDFGGEYRYRGVVRRFGLDVGFTEASTLGWLVFAPTHHINPADLSGSYGGVTAGAAVGVGANANALVGGSHNAIALQPVSLEGQAGVNIAIGVADLELRFVR